MRRGVGIQRGGQRLAERYGKGVFQARRYGDQVENLLGLRFIMLVEKRVAVCASD